MNARGTTRVSVLTPGGRGAVAVVAVEGSGAVNSVGRYFQATNSLSLCEQSVGRIVYGHWGAPDTRKTRGEDVVVCRRRADSLEIHCHGGRESSAEIVADLIADGCTVLSAEQWLEGHYVCPLKASAHRALAQATTMRTATILLDQYHGALRSEVEAIDVELGSGNTTEPSERIEDLLQYGELGRHLTEPWRVVIAGQPNVGKSSLINALVGYERAIVFNQPGTTRDIVSSTTAIEGWPVELSDTAGLRETSLTSEFDVNETAGMTLARQRLLTADLVVWVLDAMADCSEEDFSGWKRAQQQAQGVGVRLDPERTQIVVNKIDLARFLAAPDSQTVGTCAVGGEGIAQLLAAIVARLVPLIPPPGAAVPFTPEHLEVLQAVLVAIDNQETCRACALLRPWLV